MSPPDSTEESRPGDHSETALNRTNSDANPALSIPSIDPDDGCYTAALKYAAAGWYVGPVRQGSKDPGEVLGKGWPHKTTRDPEEIAAHWFGTDHGVFLHVGRSGAAVIDMDHPEKCPQDALDALEESRAPFQSTRDNADGRGHYVCAMPPGRSLGNSVGSFKGCGFEVRGNNGVIIVAPTRHEKADDGGRYAWEVTGPVPVLPAVIADELPDATEASETATEAQVREFLEKHTESTRPEILDKFGWVLAGHFETGSRHDGLVPVLTGAMKEARAGYYSARVARDLLKSMFIEAATRPPTAGEEQRTDAQARAEFDSILGWAVAQANAADLDAVKARTEEKVPDDYLTGMAVPFAKSGGTDRQADEPDEPTAVPSTDPVRRYEFADNAQDAEYGPSTVSAENGSELGGMAVLDSVPLGVSTAVRVGAPYTDIVSLLDGTLPEPPKPTVLKRRDGNCIFYEHQVNWLFGDPEEGKTFVALAAVAERLILGGSALVIDLDHNTAAATVGRLLMLGAPKDALRDPSRFRYLEPEDQADINKAIEDAADWGPDVVVVDSVGELLPVFRANSNSADEFTVINNAVFKPLMRSGACVIAIDHLAKGLDSRAQGPSGTHAKRRAVGGSSIRVKAIERFTPGRGGKALLFIHKDRHGGLRAESPQPEGKDEAPAGTFTLTADDAYLYEGDLRWHVSSPRASDRNPDDRPEPELVKLIEEMDPPPTSIEDARKRLGVGQNRTAKAYQEWKAKQGDNTDGAAVTS